jgi:hypothetical protein
MMLGEGQGGGGPSPRAPLRVAANRGRAALSRCGCEVARPGWFAVQEVGKNARTRRRYARRSPHRGTILELLVGTDDSYRRIARQVGVTPCVVSCHARNLYEEHGVSGRGALRATLGRGRESEAAQRRV